MIISCLDDLDQDKFINVCSKYAINADDNLSPNDFLEQVKEYNKKYDYVFVSENKRNILKDNNIRYYVAYRIGREINDEKNHMRFYENEKIYDKLGNFKDSFQ